MKKVKYYILFPTLTEGIKMENLLKKEKIKYTIVPTPSKIGTSCSLSIMYNKKDEKRIKNLIENNNIKISGFHSLDNK